MRIGTGYDSHRFDPERTLVLGGVSIPGHPGLSGHSDGDALLHAITDAILGAMGEGDIGDLFPPSDDAWKDADSAGFLAEALRRAAAGGFRPASVDTVIVAERPRLGPWKERIRDNVAAMLGLPPDRVGVKAKTAEGLGPIGEGTSEVCAHPDGDSAQGVCDLAGNVFEWIADERSSDYTGAPLDGSARQAGGVEIHLNRGRGYRGGAHNYDASFLFSGAREGFQPRNQYHGAGIRLARH